MSIKMMYFTIDKNKFISVTFGLDFFDYLVLLIHWGFNYTEPTGL